MPERNCSSDRDIWPSCVFGERLREIARCLSSRESLMWSARRNSCGGFVVDIAAAVIVEGGMCGLGGGDCGGGGGVPKTGKSEHK